jgi:general secretion pathway protein G
VPGTGADSPRVKLHHPLALARPRRRAGHKGWTLLEMAIVAGLLGVLLALALPAYQRHRNKVLSGHAAQEIAMMSAAIEAWRLDNRAWPPSLASVNFANRADPWGRPYVYYNVDARGRGHARKDRALNPVNTDFDLYSRGPDGLTHNQISHRNSEDDILRAGNGRFVGIARDF